MNGDSVNVHVLDKGRGNLCMRARDPITRKEVTRSTGTSDPKQAAKAAAKWEAELQEGRYKPSSRMRWKEFRDAWEDAHAHTLRPGSLTNYAATFNAWEEFCSPQRVGDLTTARVTAFTAHLRRDRTRTVKRDGEEVEEVYRIAEASVARHLRTLKAVARWANGQEMLPVVPRFVMPKRADSDRMKGRPITGEEFDRLLEAVPKVVGDDAAESWKFLLRGYWTMGLRLEEGLKLRWDYRPGCPVVHFDSQGARLSFDGASHKAGKTQVIPLVPEGVRLLQGQARPSGFVFNPMRIRGAGVMNRDPNKFSRLISRIGDRAGIVTDAEKGRTATAHDLRRSFGDRWSRLVMPAVLKDLMRHASIETTLKYYVGHDLQATAEILWAAVGDSLGDTPTRAGGELKRNPAKTRAK